MDIQKQQDTHVQLVNTAIEHSGYGAGSGSREISVRFGDIGTPEHEGLMFPGSILQFFQSWWCHGITNITIVHMNADGYLFKAAFV